MAVRVKIGRSRSRDYGGRALVTSLATGEGLFGMFVYFIYFNLFLYVQLSHLAAAAAVRRSVILRIVGV